MSKHTPVLSIPPEVALARHLQAHLKSFLAPLLRRLSTTMDVRLVQTTALAVEALVRLRQRPQALWLTEIGTLLLGAAHAPAGVKRVARLLASPNWTAAGVEAWLLEQADQIVRQEEDVALVAFDQSVLEKPESQAALGLCPVRSSKARRLARPRPGFGAGSPRPPVTVPGVHWLAATVMGWSGPALLAVCRWWSPRPSSPSPQRQREGEVHLLRDLVARWGRRVLFVWDRGFAGRPFLEVALAEGARFVVRWPKRNYLCSPGGLPTNAWRLTAGKRAWGEAQLWDARRRCWLAVRFLAVPVRLPGNPTPLWLVASRGRPGTEPWRLLTNEPVETSAQAWRIVRAYGRRWQVECALRLGKSDWGLESCRQHYWERRAKLLALASLALAFLVSLVASLPDLVTLVLRAGCHRTGRRARQGPSPLYRLHAALAWIWMTYLPAPLVRAPPL
jgi:hypothetical protein